MSGQGAVSVRAKVGSGSGTSVTSGAKVGTGSVGTILGKGTNVASGGSVGGAKVGAAVGTGMGRVAAAVGFGSVGAAGAVAAGLVGTFVAPGSVREGTGVAVVAVGRVAVGWMISVALGVAATGRVAALEGAKRVGETVGSCGRAVLDGARVAAGDVSVPASVGVALAAEADHPPTLAGGSSVFQY